MICFGFSVVVLPVIIPDLDGIAVVGSTVVAPDINELVVLSVVIPVFGDVVAVVLLTFVQDLDDILVEILSVIIPDLDRRFLFTFSAYVTGGSVGFSLSLVDVGGLGSVTLRNIDVVLLTPVPDLDEVVVVVLSVIMPDLER